MSHLWITEVSIFVAMFRRNFYKYNGNYFCTPLCISGIMKLNTASQRLHDKRVCMVYTSSILKFSIHFGYNSDFFPPKLRCVGDIFLNTYPAIRRSSVQFAKFQSFEWVLFPFRSFTKSSATHFIHF
jgi:hypothetical protein